MKFCGPGLLGGITIGQWRELWRRRDLEFDRSRAPRIFSILFQSLKNSVIARSEQAQYEQLIAQVKIHPPLFILGHWRQGTTLLHYLLAQDWRFGFPNSYQVSFPHTFLASEARDSKWLSRFVPSRRPMDNMTMSLDEPQEDEFALCAATLKSPCMGWVFPRQKQASAKYLTWREADAEELAGWRMAFRHFAKKVQWRNGPRPLVLKSPPHTARIARQLDLFPDARFVHIHRNPYAVFQSTCRTFRILQDWHSVQRPCMDDLEDWILRQYREMYDAFFEEKQLIPAGRFHELGFGDLEREPLGEMRRLYEALQLPGFGEVEPALRRYMDSLAGYRKNEFPTLDPELRERIHHAWRPSFEAWSYPEQARAR